MLSRLCLTMTCALAAGSLHAVVIVDGVPGGDADNASPFETLAAAVQYANANVDPVIEIHTNGPLPGVYFADTALATPLTIQAGAGFSPVINSAVHFLPTNDSQQVNLLNITISTNLEEGPTTAPLHVGCNLTATNCIFNANPASGKYQPAVTCAVPSTGSESTLTLTSCTLTGHSGLEAGRSCSEYIINKCIIEAIPTALDPRFSPGIANARNFPSGLSSGPRMGAELGFNEITVPRSVTINDSVVRGGMPLGWPSNANGLVWHVNENSTIGPVTATNTVFVPLRNTVAAAQASVIGNPSLPQNQDASLTLRHCTFSGQTPVTGGIAFGFLYFPATQPATHTIVNCFFDGPSTNYAVFNPTGSTQVLQGDANSYNVRPDRELIVTGGAAPGVPFESTQVISFDAIPTDPAITDTSGNLLVKDSRVVANAVTLLPPVLTDKDGQVRPMPVTALRSDVGADEVDESIPSSVRDWSVY